MARVPTSEGIMLTMSIKRFEPTPRKACGKPEHYVRHRFPIKGGIDAYAVMARAVTKENALLRELLQKKGK